MAKKKEKFQRKRENCDIYDICALKKMSGEVKMAKKGKKNLLGKCKWQRKGTKIEW